MEQLSQSGPGGAEEARNRPGADGSAAGLSRRETVSMELRGSSITGQTEGTPELTAGFSADTFLGFNS